MAEEGEVWAPQEAAGQADPGPDPGDQAVAFQPDEEAPAGEAREPDSPGQSGNWGGAAQQVLQEIVDRMGLRATAVVHQETASQIVLELEGEDIARLIGRQGETLNSLQLLLSVILNKRQGANKRILLDAEGYRSRRESVLRKRALEVAEQVKATGKEALLDSLKPHERRIIHVALADDPHVITYSEGEGPNRYLVISPRD